MTNMTITTDENLFLTAYNRDIQRFMMHGDSCTTHKKTTILETIEEAVINAGASFERLFPPKTKRQSVLDYIVFLLSGSGICKVSATKIAKESGVSVRTVSDAVKNIKETGEILVGGLADGKNKYVFVLKSHPNFNSILKEVFFLDNAEQIAGQIAEQENVKSVGDVSVEADNSSPNYTNSFISLSSKQESNNYIRQSIEIDFEEVTQDPEKEAEYISTYYVSNFQKEVYDYIKSENSGFHDSVKESASIIGLRVGSNSNHKDAVKATQTVIKINNFIASGGIVREGVVPLFTMMYKHGLKMSDYEKQYNLTQQQQLQAVTQQKVKKVSFYNWLEERD